MTEVPYCTCSHAAQVHCPGGVLADTTERGHGQCTANRCICDTYRERR